MLAFTSEKYKSLVCVLGLDNQVSVISDFNYSLNCPVRNRFLPEILPSHIKCSNVIDNSDKM